MRKVILLLLILPFVAQAQNWALINPAYRYNYSNDGTDTISNQIRVMHVDTLGVDSFRYDLNLVGVVCDTCPASLGGPCDGCFVRVDQPQFLGYACGRSGSDWLFYGVDTFLIRTGGGIGSTWTYDEHAGIIATVDTTWADLTFATPDSLRRILLSSGDTLLISRSFGILRFVTDAGRFDLIGVQGADVGRLLPGPLAYFDYHPGDELTYEVNSIYRTTPPGGIPYYVMSEYYWKVRITDRTDSMDSVGYATSIARTFPDYYDDPSECSWPIPSNSWSFNATDVLSNHSILGAYPGQVLHTSICTDGDLRFIARQSTLADGRMVMYSQPIGNVFGEPSSGFDTTLEVAPNVFPLTLIGFNVRYEEGLGIRLVESVGIAGYFELRVELVGALVGGDTIIPPPVIAWTVGVHEDHAQDFVISPNPATESVVISGATGNRSLMILDLEGRVVRGRAIIPTNGVINVHDLKAGIYMMDVEGVLPQRLAIVH